MLVATSIHNGDCDQAIRLYRWIAKLSPSLKAHDCLLVADPETPFEKVVELKRIASEVFDEVRLETLPESKKGWPDAAEYAFKFTSQYIGAHWHRPFLWMESDCVPLKPTWLDELEREYAKQAGGYMGYVYSAEATQPHLPQFLMSGIAIYPGHAGFELSFPENAPLPWDVNNSEKMIFDGKHTNLIKHFWGQPDLAPLFVAKKSPGQPVNALPLSFIPPECVLFHRCKNASLIWLMEEKYGLPPDKEDAQQTFIQLGRNGDIILLLPAMLAIYQRTGFKPRMIVSSEYASVLDGVSYVERVSLNIHWWNGMGQARAFADLNFGGGQVTQCYAHGWGIDLSKWPNFSTSMWDRTGVPISEMQRLPLVFDKRNATVERNLIKAHRKTSLPVLIISLNGQSSPFHAGKDVFDIVNKFRDRFEIIDIGMIRAPHIYDLLGLFDIAAGIITSDTATLWLAQASPIPSIAFSVDGWCGSIPRGNCVLNLRYSEVAGRKAEMEPILEKWASK